MKSIDTLQFCPCFGCWFTDFVIGVLGSFNDRIPLAHL